MSLVICLTMTLSLHSQTLSSDSLVCVPRSAVENALNLKSKYALVVEDLTITQNLVDYQKEKLDLQSEQLSNFAIALESKDKIIDRKDNIITLRDEQVKTLKRQKRGQFWNGLLLGTAGGASIITVLFIL